MMHTASAYDYIFAPGSVYQPQPHSTQRHLRAKRLLRLGNGRSFPPCPIAQGTCLLPICVQIYSRVLRRGENVTLCDRQAARKKQKQLGHHFKDRKTDGRGIINIWKKTQENKVQLLGSPSVVLWCGPVDSEGARRHHGYVQAGRGRWWSQARDYGEIGCRLIPRPDKLERRYVSCTPHQRGVTKRQRQIEHVSTFFRV